MQRFDAVGRWLRDHLLPASVIVLGGILLIRCVRWIEPTVLLTGAGSHA